MSAREHAVRRSEGGIRPVAQHQADANLAHLEVERLRSLLRRRTIALGGLLVLLTFAAPLILVSHIHEAASSLVSGTSEVSPEPPDSDGVIDIAGALARNLEKPAHGDHEIAEREIEIMAVVQFEGYDQPHLPGSEGVKLAAASHHPIERKPSPMLDIALEQRTSKSLNARDGYRHECILRESTPFYVARTHVNLRSAPQNDSAVLAVIPTGSDVMSTGKATGWVEVEFSASLNRRVVGWVYSAGLAKIAEPNRLFSSIK